MKKYFLTGLITLLPLAITFWIASFIIDFLTKPFLGVVTILTNKLPIASPELIKLLSQAAILIGLFLLVFFLGFVARKFLFIQFIRLGDRIMIKIPLVNKVYKTSKEIIKSIFGSKTQSFKQVVMIPFPYEGSYCIGLVAREAPPTCSDVKKDDLISVFIPTTPNPTTGFLVMSHKSELIYLDMTTEEAIKYVVSCGVVQPEEECK